MKQTSITILAALITLQGYSQFDYSKKLIGISINPGLSYSTGDHAVSNGIRVNQLALAWGFYVYYPINKNGSFPIHYLRADVGGGFRSGFFTINNLNQEAIVTSRYTELTLMAPFTWEVNDQLAANIGFGGGMVWVSRQSFFSEITPTPIFEEGNAFKGVVLFDYHLLFKGKSNALIGSRFLVETSKYAYGEWSVYFGFGLEARKIKERIKKWTNR